MKQKAVSFIEEVLAFSYEDIYYVYYRTDDSLCSYIDFMFVQDDKTYVLEYTWDGIFRRVSKGTFTTYGGNTGSRGFRYRDHRFSSASSAA